jgi:iron complex outermembrane receptor protein
MRVVIPVWHFGLRRRAAILLALAGIPAAAQEVSEKDYFGDLPVVLSVSRLAQPLDEVPGSVTVIDRDTIRRSGARDLAEVLRLVPGFLLTYRTGANPQAVYHSGMDTYGARMQMYVDGRSVYSSFLLGDTKVGMRGVVLEDIERIEVLRGSNSASYGANAFLGVVNVITRNAADTHGGMVSVRSGNAGIDDNVFRYGWGDSRASFRLTAARKSDRGLNNVYDDRHDSSFLLRADLVPSSSDDIMIQLGASELSSGDGEGLPGNPTRTTGQGSVFLLGQWRRSIAPDEKLEVRASYEREFLTDSALVRGTLVGSAVSAMNRNDGSVARAEVGVTHSFSLNDALRLAWGGELKHESLLAPGLYSTSDAISLHLWRAFGTVEWRPHPQWLLQASGMEEGHSYTGTAFSPRFAVNYHLTPDHTLRAGVTKSQRAPNFYELRADTRWLNLTPGTLLAGVIPVPVGTQVPVVGWPYLSSGTVKPETLISNEIGYLGYIRPWNLKVDVRAFVERMNDRIQAEARLVPNTIPLYAAQPALRNYSSQDFVNRPGPHLHGFEYQFDWQPRQGTRLMLSESHIRSEIGFLGAEAQEAPHRATTIAWMQSLPASFEFSAISSATTPFKWAGGGDVINTPRRLDLRLGRPFVVGTTRGELSVTAQAINGGSQVFKLNQRFDRRAFATLRLDF